MVVHNRNSDRQIIELVRMKIHLIIIIIIIIIITIIFNITVAVT